MSPSLALRAPRRRDADFLPAVVEIIETPPSPLGRAMLWTILLLVAIAGAWAWFGKVDIIASARGVVLPSGRIKEVQPLQPGTVAAIHVQDGTAVRRGDLLIELDRTAAGAELAAATRSLMLDRIEAARLRAALAATQGGQVPAGEVAFATPEAAEPAALEEGRARLRYQLDGLRARLAGLAEQATKLRSTIAEARLEIARLEQTIPVARQSLEIRETLARNGLGSRLESLAEKQKLIGLEHDLPAARARLAQAESELAGLAERRQESLAEFRAEAASQLAAAEGRIAVTAEERAKAAQRLRETRLVAPVDGVVQDLAIHTVGGVATAAQRLLAVVPAEDRLEIEAQLPDRDAAFVEPGQTAVVKLDAYPFTRYGRITGRVTGIARNAVADEKHGLRYAVRVTLDALPPGVTPRSGMAADVEIWTGRRRVADYILSPLEARRDAAFRER